MITRTKNALMCAGAGLMISLSAQSAIIRLIGDGKPLSSLIREQLENNPLPTLKTIAAFNPKESNVTLR